MTDLRSRAASAFREGASPGGWMRGSVWTVLDQGLFAGANFIVNVLLARWLVPEAYGSFAIAFIVFLLVGTVHGGLLIEPMLVFGAGRFKGRLPAYLRFLLRAHLAVASVAGVVLAAIGGIAYAAGAPALGADFLALSVAQAFILALWLMRRACYVESRPEWAASAGALYLALLIAGAVWLGALGWLSGPTALALMALGSAVAALVLAARLGVVRERGGTAALADEAHAAHVEYGRWSGTTGVLEWGRSALPYFVLPLFIGLEGSGALRALYNLAMPALQAFAALTVLALPVFVRARAEGTIRAVGSRVTAALLGLAGLYAVVLLALGRPLLDWLYDGQYTVSTLSLAALAALPAASVLSGLLMALLRSDERPEAVFRARAWGVGATASVGTALAAGLGVAGALLSDFLSLLTEAVVMRRALGRSRRRPSSDEPTDRLHVLASAFACLPGAGSEPGVGWNFVTEIARRHDVTVLTYGGYKRQIEAELAVRPVPGLSFEYYTLPFEDARYAVEGGQREGISEQLHYYAWQLGAARVARRLHAQQNFDLVHHVTYVKYWAPSALAGVDAPFIWGPVGGGESAPKSFYRDFSPAGRRYEQKRDVAQALFERFPSVRRTARSADLAFATTGETRDRLVALGAPNVEVRSAIGLSRDEIARLGAYAPPDDGPRRFLSIGRQIAFKGFRFGLLAFTQALATAAAEGDDALDDAELWLIGDGPEHNSLTQLIDHLGLEDRVRLLGVRPRPEVLERLGSVHALLHPSLHESGGVVCLEAMAAGRPVIGFDTGGTAVHVRPGCGLLVPANDPMDGISQLAGAIRMAATDPEAVRVMGQAGRRAVADLFCWEDKAADMAERYWDVAGRLRKPAGSPTLDLVASP